MHKTTMRFGLFFAAGVLALTSPALEFSSIFQDDMVLQRSRTQKIWGKAEPGVTVSLTLKDETGAAVASAVSAPAAADGLWLAELTTPGASFAAHTLTATAGGESVSIGNVLLGDVWLAGGQSNMAFPLDRVYDKGFDRSEPGGDIRFRLLGVPNNGEKTPVVPYELQGGSPWMTARAAAADLTTGKTGDTRWRHFSAVSYFFAKSLRDTQGIPVGMVAGSRCGTPITTFMPGDDMWNYTYGPITNLAVTGMIFYQGCSDGGPAAYVTKMQQVVKAFRTQWGRTADEFPFYYVQIASNCPRLGMNNAWSQEIFDYDPMNFADFAISRENQRLALAGIPNSGLVVSFDCGATYGFLDKSRGTVSDDPTTPSNIHPRAKKPIGTRLARFARAGVYGEAIQASGPLFSGAACVGDGKICVSFQAGTTGVNFVAGLRDVDTNDDAYEVEQPIFGFAVAGEDKVYRWAGATPDGATVVVSSPEVPNPKYVRYCAFAQPAHKPYLYAKTTDGVLLPAVPFAEQTATGWSDATGRTAVTSLADCTIVLPLAKYYAVNRSCRARPLVYAPNGALLKENVSYSVSYANVSGPGTATVTVTAKSPLFTGSKSAAYTLSSLDLSDVIENTFSGSAMGWTGGPVMPPHKFLVPSQRSGRLDEEDVWQMGGWDAMCLRPGTDYTVSGDCTTPGSHTLTVVPLAPGLTGTRTLTATIQVPIERCTISVVEPQEYTGSAVTPTVTVTAPDGCPAPTCKVSYKDNVEPTDQAVLTVTGTGTYMGGVEIPFAIYRKGEPMPTRTVRFTSFGETVATVSVPFGTAATAPEAPVAAGWTFAGWDADGSRVTADLTVRARWTRKLAASSFAKKATIGFPGYAAAETVNDFVALVKISPAAISGFSYADCAADGSDIRFADASGNLVGHEIDTWNSSGESLVWVRVPELKGRTTQMTMYWGGTGSAAPKAEASDTWRAYAGVWHLNEIGDGVRATMADATGLSTCSCNSDISFATDGVIGGGRANRTERKSGEFAAGFGGLVRAESAAEIAPRAGHRFTVSFWARPSDLSDRPYAYFSNGVWEKSLGTYTAGKTSASIGRYGEFRLWGGPGAASNPTIAGNDRLDVWRKYDISFDGPNLSIYSDGTLLTNARTDGWSGRVDPLAAFTVGGLSVKVHNNAPSFYRGTMDEARFLCAPASAGRMAADYATVAENATFTSYSAAVAATDEDPEPPAHEHSWGDWVETKPAKVGVAGEETRTCAGCGETETRETDPLPQPEPEPEPGTRITTSDGYIIPLDCGSYTNLVRVFTNTESTLTWTVPEGVTTLDYLVVGGGGGGGYQLAGGGGGGGVCHGEGLSVTPSAAVEIVVGAGGDGAASAGTTGANGAASAFGAISALGGGGGGSFGAKAGVSTDCANAGGSAASGGAATGTGGAGAGGAADGVNGGAGSPSDITGASLAYGAGGGWGGATAKGEYGVKRPVGGKGGAGGGDGATFRTTTGKIGVYDDGEYDSAVAATAGTDGLGGGGGGGGHSDRAAYAGARGGDGVVIVRYRLTGEMPKPEHIHAWGEWAVTRPAGRGVAGEEQRTCASCGDVETREIPALPTDFSHTNFVGRVICVGDSIFATGPRSVLDEDGRLKEGSSMAWIHDYYPLVEVLGCAANGWRGSTALNAFLNIDEKTLAKTDAVIFRIGLNDNYFGDPFDTGDHKPTFTFADVQDRVAFEDALPHLGSYASASVIRMANRARKLNPKVKLILLPYMMYSSYDRYESRGFWRDFQALADGLGFAYYNYHLYGGDTSKNAYDRLYSIDQCHHAALRHEFEGNCVARHLEQDLADGATVVRSSPRGKVLVAGDNGATATTLASAYPDLAVRALTAGTSADLFASVRALSDAEIRQLDLAVLRAGSGEGAFGNAVEVLPQHDPAKAEVSARNRTGLDWDYRWNAYLASAGYVWPRSCGPDAVAECASNTVAGINQTVASIKAVLANVPAQHRERVAAVVDYMEKASDAEKLAELTTGFRWTKNGVTTDIATLDQYWTALGTSPCANVAKAAQYLRLRNPRIKIVFEKYADDADANAGLDSIANPYQLNWPCVATADVADEVYYQTMTRTSAAYWEESEEPDTRTPVTLPPQGVATFVCDGQDHRPSFAETAEYTVTYSAAAFVEPGSYDVTFTLKDATTHRWADHVGDIVIYKYDITEPDPGPGPGPGPEPGPEPVPGEREATDYGYRMKVAVGSVTNMVCVFTNVSQTWEWTVPSGVTALDYLVVGGGGGGGAQYGGGGGGGGVLTNASPLAVGSGDTLAVMVGAGGAGGAYENRTANPGQNGGASAITNGTMEIACALGGGGGAKLRSAGLAGANGGGGSKALGGAATMSGGHAGGGNTASDVGSGGGGAGGEGGKSGPTSAVGVGGAGGLGVECAITGVAVRYAGGGGGGGADNGSGATYYAAGGVGCDGGGNGGSREIADGVYVGPILATPGVDGLGGGGGGGAHGVTPKAGAKGGDGVVILRYALAGGEPPVEPQPTVDGKRVDPKEVFDFATSAKPIVYPSAPKLVGIPGNQTIEFGGVSVGVPVYYTATLNDRTVSLVLNDNAKPRIAEEDATQAFVLTPDGKVELHLTNVHLRLFYALQTCAKLGDDWATGEFVQGQAKFTAERDPDTPAAFYRVVVHD